jgi:hypothetical protein
MALAHWFAASIIRQVLECREPIRGFGPRTACPNCAAFRDANKRAFACTIRANFKPSKAAPPSVNLAGELLSKDVLWNDDVITKTANKLNEMSDD